MKTIKDPSKKAPKAESTLISVDAAHRYLSSKGVYLKPSVDNLFQYITSQVIERRVMRQKNCDNVVGIVKLFGRSY